MTDPVERRAQRRISLRLPVQVQASGVQDAIMGVTMNLSAKDAFIVLPHDFTPRPELDFILEFPPEITLTAPQLVRCKGITKRVDGVPPGRVGIAVTIDHYEFL